MQTEWVFPGVASWLDVRSLCRLQACSRRCQKAALSPHVWRDLLETISPGQSRFGLLAVASHSQSLPTVPLLRVFDVRVRSNSQGTV
jgi:hypothetical protein